jgi:4-carboxymuconolactone decarboxylase
VPAALAAGLSPKIIEAIRVGEEPEFESPGERVIYDFCSQLLRTHFVDEATHAALRQEFGVTGAIEVVAVVGSYVMVAMALNGHAYPLPPAARDLLPEPPDKPI